MPDRQPIGNRHAWSKTDMPDQRPTYILIGDKLETDIPNLRAIRD